MNPENEEEKALSPEEKMMRYEYYVHYIGIDRRNERWVTEHFLKVDQDEIARQEVKLAE